MLRIELCHSDGVIDGGRMNERLLTCMRRASEMQVDWVAGKRMFCNVIRLYGKVLPEASRLPA